MKNLSFDRAKNLLLECLINIYISYFHNLFFLILFDLFYIYQGVLLNEKLKKAKKKIITIQIFSCEGQNPQQEPKEGPQSGLY